MGETEYEVEGWIWMLQKSLTKLDKRGVLDVRGGGPLDGLERTKIGRQLGDARCWINYIEIDTKNSFKPSAFLLNDRTSRGKDEARQCRTE
jgi:hypothetical protein